MGLVDVFTPEQRVEMTYSQFYSLVKEATKTDLLMNAVKNKVDYDAIHTMMTGEHLPEPIKAIEINTENEVK